MKKLLIPGMLVALFAFACSKKDSSSPSSTTTGSTTSTTSTTGTVTKKIAFTVNKKIMDLGDTLKVTNASTSDYKYFVWDWNGDANPTPSKNASHVFSKRGTYIVTLTGYLNDSATRYDTTTMKIVVGHKQLTGFTVVKAAPTNPSNIYISANPTSKPSDVQLTETNTSSTYPFSVNFKTPVDLNDTTTTTWFIRFVDNHGTVVDNVQPTVNLSKVFTNYIQMAPGSSTQDVRLNYTVVK